MAPSVGALWIAASLRSSRLSVGSCVKFSDPGIVGMPGVGWPPDPRRGSVGRLAMGLNARRHQGRRSAPVNRLMSCLGLTPADNHKQDRGYRPMSENATSPRVLGCDVGKDSVVVFDSLTATTQTVENTVAALTRAFDHLERDTLLVCEATGGYETALLTTAVPGSVHPSRRSAQDQRLPALAARPWQDRHPGCQGAHPLRPGTP